MTRTRIRDGTDGAVDALRRWLEGQDAALDEWLEATHDETHPSELATG